VVRSTWKDDRIDNDGDGTVSQTAGGNIRYYAGQDVALGQLNAGTGVVSVTAGNNITDANGNATNITASAARLLTRRE